MPVTLQDLAIDQNAVAVIFVACPPTASNQELVADVLYFDAANQLHLHNQQIKLEAGVNVDPADRLSEKFVPDEIKRLVVQDLFGGS